MVNQESTVESRAKPVRFDLRLGDWGVHIRRTFIEVYRAEREDLAHLSMFFATTQGGLDFHLTFDHDAFMRGEVDAKARVPLLQVSAEQLHHAGATANVAFERAVRAWVAREFRRFHPDWLRRNGYLIMLQSRCGAEALIEQLIPWRRQKYRLDPSWSQILVREGSEVDTFDPQVLNEVARSGVRAGLMADSEYFVTATKLGGDPNDQIALSFDADRNGRRGWWGIHRAGILQVHEELLERFFDWLCLNATDEHRAAWEHIVAGLGLHERAASREFADNVRQALRGRNPIRDPF